MRIAGKLKLEEFWNLNSRAEKPLRRWLEVVGNARWDNYADVRRTFNTADWYKGYIIFNVGGNKYRVITGVNFARFIIIIAVVMTHSEYNEEKWKEKL